MLLEELLTLSSEHEYSSLLDKSLKFERPDWFNSQDNLWTSIKDVIAESISKDTQNNTHGKISVSTTVGLNLTFVWTVAHWPSERTLLVHLFWEESIQEREDVNTYDKARSYYRGTPVKIFA